MRVQSTLGLASWPITAKALSKPSTQQGHHITFASRQPSQAHFEPTFSDDTVKAWLKTIHPISYWSPVQLVHRHLHLPLPKPLSLLAYLGKHKTWRAQQKDQLHTAFYSAIPLLELRTRQRTGAFDFNQETFPITQQRSFTPFIKTQLLHRLGLYGETNTNWHDFVAPNQAPMLNYGQTQKANRLLEKLYSDLIAHVIKHPQHNGFTANASGDIVWNRMHDQNARTK